MTSHEISPRVPWLDTVRVFACFLVCVIHAPIPQESGSVWLSAYNYLSAPCVGLFFMLSGALLFPVRQPLRVYVPRKVRRIALPLVFWSVVCVVLEVLLDKCTLTTGIVRLIQMPFRSVNGVYWFLYVLLGLYLFAPLVSDALKRISNTRYWLVLWGVSLAFPYVNAWVTDAWPVKGDYYHILSEFGGYMGYMVLGYYLRNNSVTLGGGLKKWLVPSAFLIIFIPAYFINGRYEAIDNSMLYGYLTINVALMCVLYFLIIKLLPPPITSVHAVSKRLAPQTFGIYLIHIFVMRDGIWPLWSCLYPHASYAVQIPCVAVLAFAISWLLVKLISFIPGSRYII